MNAKQQLLDGLRKLARRRGWEEQPLIDAATKAWAFGAHYQAVLAFSVGFLFDAITLDRIDAWLDLLTQFGYIAALTVVLLLQKRAEQGYFKPQGRWAVAWEFNADLLHFLFGGLLSAYVIFYTKSGVNARTFLFFAVVAGLLVYNELPKARRWGLALRLAVYAFCVGSFLIYFVPVVLGKMSDGVFVLSLALTALWTAGLGMILERGTPKKEQQLRRLLAPAAVLLAVLGAFYFLRWVPPVPLSMKFAGIYHNVKREGNEFSLTYERRGWWDFMRHQDRPFYSRPGDRLYCFVRIFAPTRFSHAVRLHWLKKQGESWESRDRIPLRIRGGRSEGWRGFGYKEHYEPGEWQVRVESADGRVLGQIEFRVIKDKKSGARRWQKDRM
jgi:hypothetical protein